MVSGLCENHVLKTVNMEKEEQFCLSPGVPYVVSTNHYRQCMYNTTIAT